MSFDAAAHLQALAKEISQLVIGGIEYGPAVPWDMIDGILTKALEAAYEAGRMDAIRDFVNSPVAMMSYAGRLVPIDSNGMREVVDEATALRKELATARTEGLRVAREIVAENLGDEDALVSEITQAIDREIAGRERDPQEPER